MLTRICPVDDYGIGNGFLEPTYHYWIPTGPDGVRAVPITLNG
ncbi:hypothetical protein HNP11_000355 [Tsukamurella ocularis]|nr:hypothetical protein [Tsukamurella ocularis]MCS3849566.1 hypothetical protein [Tsukamurella ocularis]